MELVNTIAYYDKALVMLTVDVTDQLPDNNLEMHRVYVSMSLY